MTDAGKKVVAVVNEGLELRRRESAYIDTAAWLYKDGECVFCHGDPTVETAPHECLPFELENDAAVDTLHNLISEAREIWFARKDHARKMKDLS